MTRHTTRGSVSVELAILLPAFLALIGVAIVAGRVNDAYHAVSLAAHDAARAASLSRDPATAEQRADQVARTTLADQGIACLTVTVDTDTSQYRLPVGQHAFVDVTVTCEVTFADVALPGVDPTRELSVRFTSPLDTWRARTLGFDASEVSSATNRSGGGL